MATIRGTTPTITFNLPFSVDGINNCEVYFGQNDELLLEKGYEDCVLSGTTIAVPLTQADTLLFDYEEKLQVQLRFMYNDQRVEATSILKGKVGQILKDGEINVRSV